MSALTYNYNQPYPTIAMSPYQVTSRRPGLGQKQGAEGGPCHGTSKNQNLVTCKTWKLAEIGVKDSD
jgi:hypothetical protein